MKESDIVPIIEEHLLKGRIVAGLAHAPVAAMAAEPTGASVGLTREQRRVVLDKAWTVDPREHQRGPGRRRLPGPGKNLR